MSHINDEQWEDMLDLFEEDFVDLVNNFIIDSQERIVELKQAHKDGDNNNGLEVAHALKGAASNLGAEDLAKHSSTMQTICHAQMIQHAFNVVDDIDHEFAQLIKEIEKRLGLL